MIITVKDIQDYMNCPMLYQLKKENKPKEIAYSSIDEKYINELKRMIYFFFEQIKNHGYCRAQLLKDRWKDLWIGERAKKDILLPSDDPIKKHYRKRERDGWAIILDIWDAYSQEKELSKYEIIGTSIPFTFRVNDNIMVSGELPIVRLRDGKADVMLMKYHDPQSNLKKDIEITIYSLGYRKLFNSKEDSLTVYTFDNHKELRTVRFLVDYEIAKETISEIARGMDLGIRNRVLNKKCVSCTYYHSCRGKENLIDRCSE